MAQTGEFEKMSDNEEIPWESTSYKTELPVKLDKVHGGKGRKKTGGRKKGVKNKISRFEGEYIERTLHGVKCDPLASLARIAQQAEKDGNLSVAVKSYSTLLEYIVPKKKEKIQADTLSALVFSWQAEPDSKEITGITINQVLNDDEIE
jgi:hypothetical protein